MVFGNGVAAELIATGQEGSLKSTQVLVSNPLYIILGMVLGLGLSGLFFGGLKGENAGAKLLLMKCVSNLCKCRESIPNRK